MEKEKHIQIHIPKINSKIVALLAVLAMTLFCASGILNKADHALADLWYQEVQASAGDIVLIEIDETTLEESGPFQDWNRPLMAEL